VNVAGDGLVERVDDAYEGLIHLAVSAAHRAQEGAMRGTLYPLFQGFASHYCLLSMVYEQNASALTVNKTVKAKASLHNRRRRRKGQIGSGLPGRYSTVRTSSAT
jgi:hypothetical protein